MPSDSKDNTIMEKIKFRAINGHLKKTKIRSACWKYLFGLVPNVSNNDINDCTYNYQQWCASLSQKRMKYDLLISKHYEQDADDDDDDPLFNNPLSLATNTKWAQVHRNSELLNEIKKDLDRLYPTGCVCGSQFLAHN